MWEIWCPTKEGGQRRDQRGFSLIVPNLTLSWNSPKVGDTWGPFVVVKTDDNTDMVNIKPISNLITRFPESWSVHLRNPEIRGRVGAVRGRRHRVNQWRDRNRADQRTPHLNRVHFTVDRHAYIRLLDQKWLRFRKRVFFC